MPQPRVLPNRVLSVRVAEHSHASPFLFMSLTLDDREVLPVGIHDATVEEFQGLFGRFDRVERRPKLFALFELFIKEVRLTKWPCEVIADGSYVMQRVDDPDDIDVIIAVPAAVFDQFEKNKLRPFEYNVLDPSFCKREYKIDLKS